MLGIATVFVLERTFDLLGNYDGDMFELFLQHVELLESDLGVIFARLRIQQMIKVHLIRLLLEQGLKLWRHVSASHRGR